MVSLEIFIDIILPAALCLWGWLILQQKWVPEMFPMGKGDRWVGLTTLPLSCADCLEIWEPQTLEPSGPVQACDGIALPLLYGTFLEGVRKSTINVLMSVCCALSIFHFALTTLLVSTISSDAPRSLYLLLFVENLKLYHVLWECFSPGERPQFLASKNLKVVRCHKPVAHDYESNQQDAIILVNLLSLVCSTCFGRCFRPSSGALHCIYSIW